MTTQFPQILAVIAIAAFVIGWLLSWVSSKLIARSRVAERDPRDEKIYSLESELRVARAELDRLESDAEEQQQSLEDTTLNLQAQYSVISGQQAEIDRLVNSLKGSVLKTRELRAELAERATQNVYAEAKIREVETELSVAQASVDMLATGVFSEDAASESDTDPEGSPSEISKAAS